MMVLDQIITIKVYNEQNKHLISKMPDNIECRFSIYPFEDKYMAYVEVKHKSYKLDKLHHDFFGNSLWGLGSLPKQDLINKIYDYTYILDVVKDFNC